MQNSWSLSEAQRRLLLELLQEERSELRPEIHHTDNRDVRDELRVRLQMIEELIAQFQQTPVQGGFEGGIGDIA